MFRSRFGSRIIATNWKNLAHQKKLILFKAPCQISSQCVETLLKKISNQWWVTRRKGLQWLLIRDTLQITRILALISTLTILQITQITQTNQPPARHIPAFRKILINLWLSRASIPGAIDTNCQWFVNLFVYFMFN